MENSPDSDSGSGVPRGDQDRSPVSAADAAADRVQVAVYPARLERPAPPLDLTPSQALHLVTDPGRAAMAAATADSRQEVTRRPVGQPDEQQDQGSRVERQGDERQADHALVPGPRIVDPPWTRSPQPGIPQRKRPSWWRRLFGR